MAARQLISKHKTQAKAAFAAFVLVAVAVGIFVYPTQTEAQTLSGDSTLSALTVSPKNINGFTANLTSYEVGVASTVTEATVAATANGLGATVAITPPDSNTVTDGHQVTLSDGRNTVTITVTAEDTTTVKAYTVNINRGVTDPKGWKASDDLDGLIAADNAGPSGIWANDTTVWVLNSASPKKIFAYNRTTQGRDESKDITIDIANPDEIWSDGTTLWVASTIGSTAKLYAYTLATGARLETQDFDQLDGAGNLNLFGMWSDSATMWVADGADRHLYAYDRSTKVRQPEREISLAALDWVSLDLDPTGMWTDGVTIWVAAATDESPATISVRAVKFADGTRHASKDMPVATAGSTESTGLWSDGQTMLVADRTDRKVYSFNMPAASDDADLSALTVSPKNIDEFDADRTSYEVGVASTVDEATIAATANDAGASVVITPPDSNDVTGGHQAALSAGKNAVTITVTAEDGSTVKAYTVNINQGVDTAYGWKASDDFDTLVAAFNEFPSGLWSDGTTMWVADFSADRIFAYRMSNRSTQIGGEFDVLAGNTSPLGIWSDGTTMWIADGGADKLSAYRMSNKQHDDTKDFNTLSAAGNISPAGIWSDGTTMWVADLEDDKLFAYRMSDRERDPDRDFDTLADAGNNDPYGVWSDGATMWVADYSDDKIFAYRMSDRERDPDRDFDTPADAGNNDLSGIWSDGTTMWVADFSDDKIYSYNMPASADAGMSALTLAQGAGTPAEIAEFDRYTSGYTVNVPNDIEQVTVAGTKSHAQATGPVITPADAASGTDGHQVNLAVGDTAITFVVTAEDGSTNTYTVTVNRRPASSDATLSALTVSPKDINGFLKNRTSYEVGVASTVTEATVAATAIDLGLTVAITPTDSNTVTDGHQVTLSDGRNTVTITVTAEDTTTIKTYTVNINRGVTDPKGWKASDDLDGLPQSLSASTQGIWSDGTTMWVVNSGHSDSVDAYRLSDGRRDSSKDFDSFTSHNSAPRNLWSNSTTMWISDGTSGDPVIYAYRRSNGMADPDNTFFRSTLSAAGNENPGGMWSHGNTMWVADLTDAKIYAYVLSSKERDGGKDFDTLRDAGNGLPRGIWSDGKTMWVADSADDKIYAYDLATKAHVENQDFDTLAAAGNSNPDGLWSDGATMWVSNSSPQKVYAYNMPLSRDATLSALTVSPKDINGFASDDRSYEVGVASTVTEATVAATANDSGAEVEITPGDSNVGADGHQVALSAGKNTVTVTVTAGDGATIKAYTVNINQGVTTDFGWKASDDLDGLFFFGETSVSDVWRNDSTILLLAGTGRKIYAYNADGSRNSSKDVTVSSASSSFWTNGTTLWIVNSAADRLKGTTSPPKPVTRQKTSIRSPQPGTKTQEQCGRTARPCGSPTPQMTASTPTGCRTPTATPARSSARWTPTTNSRPASTRTEPQCGLPTLQTASCTPTGCRTSSATTTETSTRCPPPATPPPAVCGPTRQPCSSLNY